MKIGMNILILTLQLSAYIM